MQKLFPVDALDRALRPADVSPVAIPGGGDFASVRAHYDRDAYRFTDFETADGATLFVRVAILGFPGQIQILPLPLTYAFQDGGPFVGTVANGSFPVIDSGTSETIESPFFAENNYEFASVRAFTEASGPLGTIYRLEIQLQGGNTLYNHPSSASNSFHGEQNNWFLVIKTDTMVRATWAVGQTDAESRMPWMHVATRELRWTRDPVGAIPLLPDDRETRSLSIENMGTGPLQLATGALASGFSVDAAPVISPLSSGSITLAFVSASAGTTNELADFGGAGPSPDGSTVASADPLNEHNAQVELSARVGLVDTVLLLDASGSMGWGRDGAFSPPPDERRWDYLVDAVTQLVGGYVDFLRDRVAGEGPAAGRLKVAAFPDPTNFRASTAVTLYPPAGGDSLVDSGTPVAVRGILEALPPNGNTPLGDGVAHAIGPDASSLGLFTATGEEQENNFRYLLLLSDGAHNAGAIPPTRFYLDDGYADFVEKEVRVLTIAYGDEGATNVDYDLLGELAMGGLDGGVENAHRAALSSPTGLSKEFVRSLVTTLGLTDPVDPPGRVDDERPEALHEFTMTELDDRFAVYVSWETADPFRLLVELITPRCELITPEVAEQDERLEFRQGKRFAYFFVSKAFLEGGDEAPARFGTWTLRIQLNPTIGENEGSILIPESYIWSVTCQSSLRFAAAIGGKSPKTGESIEVLARLSNAGIPVSGAAVTLVADVPTKSQDNWLAVQVADPNLLERTERELRERGISNPFAFKQRALELAGRRFEPGRVAFSPKAMVEVEPGVYAGSVAQTTVPGDYRVTVSAFGRVESGQIFTRESNVEVSVSPFPDPERTEVVHEQDPEAAMLELCVWPRDVYGNVVLFDPSSRPRLTFEAVNGEPAGELEARLDGSYCQRFRPNGEAQSVRVDLSFDGKWFKRVNIPLYEGLMWVDRLVEYRPGDLEGLGEVNNDPRRALGPVSGLMDPGVALGRRGTIDLTARKVELRVRSITVVTRRGDILHPYALDVLPRSGRPNLFGQVCVPRKWTTVGTSGGQTKVFDLSRFGGEPLVEIRVRDLGRGRFGPNAAPEERFGVTVQGVGFVPFRRQGNE